MNGPLREYAVTINGVATTALLNEVDAARLRAVPVAAPAPPASPRPTPKLTAPVPVAAAVPADKARRADDKRAR